MLGTDDLHRRLGIIPKHNTFFSLFAWHNDIIHATPEAIISQSFADI